MIGVLLEVRWLSIRTHVSYSTSAAKTSVACFAFLHLSYVWSFIAEVHLHFSAGCPP